MLQLIKQGVITQKAAVERPEEYDDENVTLVSFDALITKLNI